MNLLEMSEKEIHGLIRATRRINDCLEAVKQNVEVIRHITWPQEGMPNRESGEIRNGFGQAD